MISIQVLPVRRGRALGGVIAVAAATALLAGASPAAAQAHSLAGPPGGARAVLSSTWGNAMEVPGIAALNTGGNAAVQAVSCASAGNCSAGGYYNAAGEAFVASEVRGTWGKAMEVPGLAALNTGGGAQVASVSCASAGNCAVGGYYTENAQFNPVEAFVVNQVHGVWGKAKHVAAALNKGGAGGGLSWVSCASTGNCSAGGSYNEGPAGGFFTQAFVVSDVHGTWGKAIEVPGTGALNTGGLAAVSAGACASAGNCTVGGFYTSSGASVPQQAFVVSEVNGVWGAAKPVAAALNQTGYAQVNSVSCATAGNCTVGGQYNDSADRGQAFVATQAHGTWGKAKEVPGTSALNTGGGAGVHGAAVTSVSCSSAGNCSAGGNYMDGSGHSQAFVATQANGTWKTAIEVPGTAALNAGGGGLAAVSCWSAGNCSAGGNYTDSSGHGQVFVAGQAGGTWSNAEQVPGSGTLNQGGFAELFTLSCAPAGTCAAGGFYAPGGTTLQAFVVNKT